DAVDPNAIARMIERHALGDSYDCKLARAIGQSIPNPNDASDGSHVNDIARLRCDHGRHECFGHIEDPSHVHRIEPVQVRSARLQYRADVANTGVVDQYVQSSPALVDALRDL